MKETIKKPNVDILMRPKLRFSGLSHLRRATEETPVQHIYLLVDNTQASTPKIQAQVKDPTKFREILLAFFQAVQKGINYVASTDALEAKEHLTSLIRSKESQSSLSYYQKMYQIMSDLDPAGFAVVDPALTICDGVCYLEVFDKYAKRSLVLTLEEELFHEGCILSNGSARIMLTTEFIASLGTITGRHPLHLHVGADVGDEDREEWKGEIVKQFSVELEWLRGALLLQGASALQLHHVDLMRIDFFNALRTLRMRKAKTHPSFKEDRELNSIRFVLEPNKQPILVFDPWDLELECMGDVYSGEKKREIVMFGQRRDLLLFDRFLPYVVDASCTVFDTALHAFVDIKGEGFSCSMVLQGFGKGNWPRRLQMESMLPSFAQRDDCDVFTTLDQTGSHNLSGEESLSERKALIADVIRGKALFVPGKQVLIRRDLFSEEIDMQRLEVLGAADTFAREHLAQGRVSMKAEYHHDGSLHFEGSTVTEPLREGEETPFVAEPSFILNPIGQLRKVRCNCVVWKTEEQRGLGGPCAHLRALWLNYCQKQEALREAKDEGLYTGPLLQEERIFTKKQEERIISFDVRAKFLFTEKWCNGEEENFRQTVQVYTTEEQVRSAFDKRAAMLLRRGYTQAGSQ